jgi:hypothetical protein
VLSDLEGGNDTYGPEIVKGLAQEIFGHSKTSERTVGPLTFAADIQQPPGIHVPPCLNSIC